MQKTLGNGAVHQPAKCLTSRSCRGLHKAPARTATICGIRALHPSALPRAVCASVLYLQSL